MEIDIKQLKQRQISYKYLLIQQSYVFLGFIERMKQQNFNHKIYVNELINLIELSSLMVQNIYLIYTAYCHKINIRINKNILIKKINKDIFFIYKTYIIEDHYNILDNSIQKYIDHNYQKYQLDTQNNKFIEYICHIVMFYLNKFQDYYKIFKDQQINYKNQLISFRQIFIDSILPNLKFIHQKPKRLIQCLEKTQVFRDNSLLLSLQINLFYQKMRPLLLNQDSIIDSIDQIQNNFQNQILNAKTPASRLKANSNILESTINLFIKKNLITLNLSQDQKTKTKQNQKQNPQYFHEKQQSIQQKISLIKRWQFHSKGSFFNLSKQNCMQFILAEDILQYQRTRRVVANGLDYMLDIDFERQIISLKIFFKYRLNNDIIDHIIYEMNIISEQWYYPSFQFVDSNDIPKQLQGKNNNTQRLCLNINFNLIPKKNNICKIMVLLDVLLIYQITFMAQFIKPKQKRNMVNSLENINKMNKLLINNIQKVYQAKFQNIQQS